MTTAMVVLLAAVHGEFELGAALTFGLPIGVLAVGIAFMYFQRKPFKARNGSGGMFPFIGKPVRRYDLMLMEAMRSEDRRELVAKSTEGVPGSDRPVGGI